MKLKLIVLLILLLSALPVLAQETETPPDLIPVEHGDISFGYDATLASEVTAEEMEAIPFEEGMPYWAASPAYTLFTFTDYPAATTQMMLPPVIYVYRTADFAEYGEEDFTMYGEWQALTALLEEQPDLAEFTGRTTTSGEVNLPALPLMNAAQVFRIQPEYVEFEGGSGVRYLTYYSQAVSPLFADSIFYTFQGLTDDGEYYISAIFPLLTDLFPTEIDFNTFDYAAFEQNYETYMTESLASLEALPADEFTPSLELLDAVVESISVGAAE